MIRDIYGISELPDGSGSLQDVEILQNVWERVESEDPQTSETNPDPAKDQGHEGRRNGEEVHKGVKLEHEDKLVIGGDESHEEVGHEKHVEEEVKLHNALSVLILQSRPV